MSDLALSEKEIEEIANCALDPEYFVDTFCWLQRKSAAGTGRPSTIPFIMGQTPDEPQYFQRDLIRRLHARKNVVMFKLSRRAGGSWAAAAYTAWLVNFHEGVNALMLSKTSKDAKKLLAKVKFILKNLSYHDNDNIRLATPAGFLRGEIIFDNTERLVIGWRDDEGNLVNESVVESLTTTDNAGRGDDASFILFDELPFYEHPDETWSSATKTLAGGGNYAVISTASSIGDIFHRMSMAGDLYLDQDGPYPGYDYMRVHWKETWLDEDEIARLSVGDTEERRLQEWEGVWFSPGQLAFAPAHLKACYKPPELYPDIAEHLNKYRRQVMAGAGLVYYYSGVDSAKGNPKKKSTEKDWHCWISLTRDSVQAFAYHSQEEISVWAGDKNKPDVKGTTSKLHTEWPGVANIEDEGPGYVTRINHEVPDDGFSRKEGFLTKGKFKKGAVERLIIKIENHGLAITDLKTYQSLSVIQQVAPGQYEAPKGYSDDPFMALVFANEALEVEAGFSFDLGDSMSMKREVQISGKDVGMGPMVDLGQKLPVNIREVEKELGGLENPFDYNYGLSYADSLPVIEGFDHVFD